MTRIFIIQVHDPVIHLEVDEELPEPRNCAAISDQSVTTLKYRPRREDACQHYHMRAPMPFTIVTLVHRSGIVSQDYTI